MWDPLFKTHLCKVKNTALGLKWDLEAVYFALFLIPRLRFCLVCSFEDVCEGLQAITLNRKDYKAASVFCFLQNVHRPKEEPKTVRKVTDA